MRFVSVWRSRDTPLSGGTAETASAGGVGSFGIGDFGEAADTGGWRQSAPGVSRSAPSATGDIAWTGPPAAFGVGDLGNTPDSGGDPPPPGPPPPPGGGLSGFFGIDFCSDDDQFDARAFGADGGGWPVVTWTNFEGVWTSTEDQPEGTNHDHAIADTTAQRTSQAAVGWQSLFGGTAYDSGSLRLYVSAKTPAQTGSADPSGNTERGSEYSLLSTNGVDFQLEATVLWWIFLPTPRLSDGEGQAESYLDEDGTIWMYYNTNGSDGDGVYVKTSTDGVSFGTESSTGLNESTVGKAGLTGLSVVSTRRLAIGNRAYRGYFNNEVGAGQSDGTIFAATSESLETWSLQPEGGSVGSKGEVIGPNSQGSLTDPSRQPFALKRNDPFHPSCVTLFYYKMPADGHGTRIWYSTAPDGVTFTQETELDLGVDAAGPTLVNVNGLAEWVRGANPPIYLLYTDGADAEDNHITQAHSVTRKT